MRIKPKKLINNIGIRSATSANKIRRLTGFIPRLAESDWLRRAVSAIFGL